MLLLGVLLLPVTVAAKPIGVSSSTFASSTVSSTVLEVNEWLQDKFGVDLYEVINKIIAFMIVVVKVTINVLLEILPKIRDFLSNY